MVPGTVKSGNGKIIGSKDYFKSYNEKVKIAGLLKESSSCSYYSDLASKKTAIKQAMNDILLDLENNISGIRFLSQSDRKELQKFLKALNEYLKFVKDNHNSVKTKCDDILILRDRRTKITAGITQREIDEAVKKIYSGGNYSRIPFAERKQLVENAVKSGLKNTIKGCRDIVKQSFLYDIAGRHDEKFLKDVLVAYKNKYQYNGKYKGKGAKNIASKEYISYHEKNIFGSGLGSDFYKDYNYKNYISNHLTELVDPFMYDLQQITNENDRKRFQAIIKDLEKCGAKMSITYYGNPRIPKRKTYTYTLSKAETKQVARLVKTGRSMLYIELQGVISVVLSFISPPLGGAYFSATSSFISIALAYDWNNLVIAAEKGKRCKIIVTGIQGESNEEFFVETFEIYILN